MLIPLYTLRSICQSALYEFHLNLKQSAIKFTDKQHLQHSVPMSNTHHHIIVALVLACLLATNIKGQNVKTSIANVSNDHPRLFVGRGDDTALREKINSDPLLREALTHVTTIADGIQRLKPVERKKVGKRLLGVSRTCLKRVLYLAVAHRLTGNKSYASRCQREMLAAARMSDWNPSHFLDVAEMTAALAIGYDWLYEELDSEARGIIKTAIIEKGFKPYLKGGWWVNAHNNWNQVCHGGVTLGALAILEDEPDLAAQIIERAVKKLPAAMAEYAPDGAYPEGPGYWDYGTNYNVILISALESVLGSDFGLSKAQGFLESSDYYLHATGPTGLFFNYSDCGSRGGVSPAMYWFAAKRKDPSLLWRERRNLKQFLAQSHNPGGGSHRLFPFVLIWAESLDEIPIPNVKHWKADGKTPVAMHRTGWKKDDEIFVGIKGGTPSANHAHMDIGSFVLDAHGVRWAVDLGLQSYHGLESKGIRLWNKSQDSQRWDVFRLNNFSHNTLVIDRKKQRVNGFAPIIDFSDEDSMPYTIVDLTSIYQGQLASAKRGIGLLNGRAVIIQDEIETLERETTVRWGMVTRADIHIDDRQVAVLRQNNQQLSLLIQAPTNATLELFETATPPHEYDAPNKGTKMIGFKVEIPASTKARFSVLLRPGDTKTQIAPPEKLDDWKNQVD